MSILDKAREAAAAALEKTREVANSAVEAVEEASSKAVELAQEAGEAVVEGVNATTEKAKELAAEAGDVVKGIGTAIADATFADSAREIVDQAKVEQERAIEASGGADDSKKE